MKTKRTLLTLTDNEFLKITYFNCNSEDIVISFSSTPRLDQGEGVAIEQFIGTLSNNDLSGIFIIDKTSSYGNRINFPEIASLIAPIVKNASRVHAVGYCMGGFLAILLSHYIHLDSVVAVTPQWSIHPSILPKESYLTRFAENISDWQYESLEGYFAEATRYYIFNSNDPDDQYQIKYFKGIDNVSIFEFGESYGHDLPEALGGDLEHLMMACIMNYPEEVLQFIG